MPANRLEETLTTANWGFPTTIRVGPGRRAELADLCRERGFAHPLVVTDPGVRDLPFFAEMVSGLEAAGLDVAVFSDIAGEPTGETVDAVADVLRGDCYDSVIAIGGGSALDAAKSAALMCGQSRPIWDFEDIGDNWKRADASRILPCIAVPTTAGTGSEVGRAAVVTNPANRRKMIIFHPRMLPEAVVLDPEATVGMPPWLTVATGMDAFSHCFEAWCAPGFHPMADGIALEGMRLVAEALPRAHVDGSDLVARTRMLAAASMGGTAFQKGLGAVHAVSHPVGALYHTHHGLTNAVVLPYVMQFNRRAIEERMVPVAQVLGLEGGYDAVLDWVLWFREQLGVPGTLAELGVDSAPAAEVGRMGEVDPPAASNPVELTAEDLSGIFVNAVEGVL